MKPTNCELKLFKKIYLIRSICILLIGTAIFSCSQTKKEGNIKYITKYNFFSLYKKNINNGYFSPKTGLDLRIFKFLDDKIIFLAGSKDLYSFYNKSGDSAVLFVSKNKGETFQEIIFPEEKVTFISLSEKFSLIETNSRGQSSMGKNSVYLLDNLTLKYKKIDEFSSKSKIIYSQFNGMYVIHSDTFTTKLVNLLTNQEIELPENLRNIHFKLSKDNKLVYLKNDEILAYNPFNLSTRIIKKLKNNYDAFFYENDTFNLVKFNLLKTKVTVYDDNENELYSETDNSAELYRYKNFACRLSQNMPYIVLDYSYDYGKTWYRYKDKKFITSSVPKGFYKDKYILLDTGFYGTENNTDIVIGEFKKP